MTTFAAPNRHPLLRSRTRWTALLLVGLVAALLVVMPGSGTVATGAPGTAAKVPSPPSGAIRMIQANVRTKQSVSSFQADVDRILDKRPDLITYNEVPFRHDSVLAPAAYDIYRSHEDRYRAATAVAWRNDRWRALDRGTWMLTERWGKDPNKNVHLGVRYANWATLEHVHNGRVVSVVSVHFPPDTKHTEGLKPVAARRTAELVQRLGAKGPVLVGGDLNIHYPSRQYPRETFESVGLTPTFQITGETPVTKQDHGSTIDYILVKDRARFDVRGQYTFDMNSDHHALVADLHPTYTAPSAEISFQTGTVSNDPNGTHRQKRRVIKLMIDAINHAPRDAGIHFDVAGIGDKYVIAALRRAHERGVHVQVINRRRVWNQQERSLRALMGIDTSSRTFAVPCYKLCQRVVADEGAPAARLLVSRSGTTPALTIIANRPPIPRLANEPTTAWIRTSKDRYDRAFANFLQLVGRTM